MNTGTDRRRANWHWKENDTLLVFGPEIGPMGNTVLDVLAIFARNDDRTAWPSIATIARIIGCSQPPVRSAIKRLEDAGLLKVEQRSVDGVNMSNHYTLQPIEDAVAARKDHAASEVENFRGTKESIVPPTKESIVPPSNIFSRGTKDSLDELDSVKLSESNYVESYDDDEGNQPSEPSTGNRHMVEQPFIPALDAEWGEAIGQFQSQLGWMGGGGPTLDEMRDMFDELREKGLADWWALAVKVAVDQNARSWAYVRQVLKTALADNRPPGSPRKGNNATNGANRTGYRQVAAGKTYDDGLSSLTAAEREKLSAQLRATRNRQQSLPGV